MVSDDNERVRCESQKSIVNNLWFVDLKSLDNQILKEIIGVV
ncbi:hypothetical protein [Ehrlichia minasensis]|nr:hypothetical protein [Ehrlichia minasensis]